MAAFGSGLVHITSPMRSGKTKASSDMEDAMKRAIAALTPATSCAINVAATLEEAGKIKQKRDISQGLVKNQGPRQRTFQRRGKR